MGEIRIVSPGKTSEYPYPVCKKCISRVICRTLQQGQTPGKLLSCQGILLPLDRLLHNTPDTSARRKFLSRSLICFPSGYNTCNSVYVKIAVDSRLVDWQL